MNLPANVVHDIELLIMFDPSNTQQGLKIHQDAAPERIAAGERLYKKGLITQSDGGYLTDSGLETLAHLAHLLGLLDVEEDAAGGD